MHTLTGMNSKEEADTIVHTVLTKEVQIKNIKTINPNIYGIICVPVDDSYDEIVTSYDNIIFNGTQPSFNPYGTVKINNSNITIESTSEIESEEICEAERVIIGGKTNIISSSPNLPLFSFRSDSTNPSVIFCAKVMLSYQPTQENLCLVQIN